MFEQYAQTLRAEVPHLDISGATYPPPRLNEILSNVMFAVRMFLILLLFAGAQVLPVLGIQNPPWIYTWAQENKVLREKRRRCFVGGALHVRLGAALCTRWGIYIGKLHIRASQSCLVHHG